MLLKVKVDNELASSSGFERKREKSRKHDEWHIQDFCTLRERKVSYDD